MRITDATDLQVKTLVAVAKNLRNKYKDELEYKKEKGHATLKRPDFLWHELLVSYSTWGGISRNEGMITDKNKNQQITYAELKNLSNEDRVNRLRQIMKDAKIRYYKKKAPMLARCFEKIEEIGGLEQANAMLLNKECAAEMTEFLDEFPGIGPKYANNIMMDCYHSFFHEKIALDSRIRSISNKLGLNLKKYSDHENFYLNITREAGIEGWELDRLIFEHRDEILNALRSPAEP
jgi:thermostable 8-oxoguanine DNA glycosylase